MGINQAIFTSSARGISKGGGKGVHTYNRACDDADLREFEQSYVQYYFTGEASEIPSLPTKILYGKTDNGRYMEACITYLGKDYDKERGRMGNLLSHMYSFDREDIRVYPMQLYGSPDFMRSIPLEEVDGSKPVEYLPEVSQIRNGEITTIEHVQDFLGDDRMEMFCHLMGAVLNRDQIHKIIICDTHENIILWLAAIEYALPLQCARNITFSSYEEDPTMSEFEIRGAVVGMSRGSSEEYVESRQFYVFDGVNRTYPEFDISADYFQYGIQMGLAFSYDSMLGFFKFLENYDYENADSDICLGFKLHQMVEGGMEQLGEKEFREAVSFEAKYGNKKSYREMLTQLFEKLENNADPDETLLSNIRILLTGYYKKNLDADEMEFILILTSRLEKYVLEHNCEEESDGHMWKELYKLMVERHQRYLDLMAACLREKGFYNRLGELNAYMYKYSEVQNPVQYAKNVFQNYWTGLSKEAYVYFDYLVVEIAKKFQKYELDEDKYLDALDMFLLVQELGKGQISGRGCELLLLIIEKNTQLFEKKQFGNKKKRSNEELEKKQARCAFEAFNYTQRNRVDQPIARIRLQHLGRCIIKAYEDEIQMTESKTLAVYSEYPVFVEYVRDSEFTDYIDYLSETIYTMETTEEDYHLLLTYWILNEQKKQILLSIFVDEEVDYVKKEKNICGMEALLNAVRYLGDEEYSAALAKVVSGLKTSHKEKIGELIKEKCERDLYEYWKKLAKEEAGKSTKKGFFSFGKR